MSFKSQVSGSKSNSRRLQPRSVERKSRTVSSLLRWYRRDGRKLPWRGEHDPYRVLVSEIMLQQTQVSRVLEKYPLFLKRFPTLEKLSRARTSEVIRGWQGMGYNNRAVRLQQLARHVVNDLGGRLPSTPAELEKLPGVGRYTAHAVACLAFGKPLPVVDTNVERVLTRLFPDTFKNHRPRSRHSKLLWDVAEEILPRRQASDWNQALMDLGARICTAAAPKCGICPVRRFCPSAHRTVRAASSLSKSEPGRDGVPNRIYRGRVVEVLRNLGRGQEIRAGHLGRQIKRKFGKTDSPWLARLLKDLQRDGLVKLTKSGSSFHVGLPE
jgi:A/G-specific adenine glycosylase